MAAANRLPMFCLQQQSANPAMHMMHVISPTITAWPFAKPVLDALHEQVAHHAVLSELHRPSV
jgi:hypothetical protein